MPLCCQAVCVPVACGQSGKVRLCHLSGTGQGLLCPCCDGQGWRERVTGLHACSMLGCMRTGRPRKVGATNVLIGIEQEALFKAAHVDFQAIMWL